MERIHRNCTRLLQSRCGYVVAVLRFVDADEIATSINFCHRLGRPFGPGDELPAQRKAIKQKSNAKHRLLMLCPEFSQPELTKCEVCGYLIILAC